MLYTTSVLRQYIKRLIYSWRPQHSYVSGYCKTITALAAINPLREGLYLYTDIMLSNRLGQAQYFPENRTYYEVVNFPITKMRYVFEIDNGQLKPVLDWVVVGDSFFLKQPRVKPILCLEKNSLYSVVLSQTESIVPLWLNRVGNRQYRDINLAGFEFSYSPAGPWLNPFPVETLPCKVYLKKPAVLEALSQEIEITAIIYA